MIKSSSLPFHRPISTGGKGSTVSRVALVCFLALGPRVLHAQSRDPIFSLERVLIGESAEQAADPTGMDSQEAELSEPPFSNEMISVERGEEDFSSELHSELQMVAGLSPVDLATGVNRVNLRGFPTPRLRNGFAQTGIPDVLNPDRVETIQGPLTPVTGRAAPGGIQNFVTARPRANPQTRVELAVSSLDQQQARFETTGPLVRKRLWQRTAGGWQRRRGPEQFSDNVFSWFSGSITYRRSRSTSLMFTVDYVETDANPAPGVPEYRLTTGGKIQGPYRPLAYFHTYGPAGHVERRIGTASAQLEKQLSGTISLRAMLLGWTRRLVEDRFTTGQYIVDTGKFNGTREPQRTFQPLTAGSAHVEVTARVAAKSSDHKLTASVDHIYTNYRRLQRGLESSDRNALPEDARFFDPDAPNYFRPAYDPLLYRRILTDRTEIAEYTSLAGSERAALWQGRLVASLGGRLDLVSLRLTDAKPGASRPHVSDRVSQFTHHAGLNYQVMKNRLLWFANSSTAFEPSTRVDARTGRIQGNETTLGYETGVKALFWRRRVSATLLLFRLYNQNISRRNPLYEDPIADANQTQPQLVAAGEERFTGGALDLKAQLTPAWSFSGRYTLTDATTTKSPDLPEEVGLPLTRLPRETVSASTRYNFPLSGGRNAWCGATLNYIGAFVSSYESASRAYLAFPGYALFGTNVGYSWKTKKKMSHNLQLGLRNLFDRDLVAVLARPGGGREVTGNYTLTF